VNQRTHRPIRRNSPVPAHTQQTRNWRNRP
jgi:hypothetical protein